MSCESFRRLGTRTDMYSLLADLGNSIEESRQQHVNVTAGPSLLFLNWAGRSDQRLQ
jgi:hypothetical protein